MIDHVLGRPSVRFRKLQVLAVVSLWSGFLLGGNRHGPPFLRKISKKLTPRLTAWQTMIISMLWLYVARNFDKLLELECPEPLANLYSPSYFRATWVTTALDAGFWTAMRIRRKWLRDLLSMVFSVYYLFAAEQADEKVRKVRGMLTVEHLRVSWNKGTTPYLSFFSTMLRPRLARYPPRAIRIPRPQGSSYNEPVRGWLYFDGPVSALKEHTKMILDIPGGGFVAMDPRKNDDKLLAWAGKTGLPILSLDYKKAPEFPYPYSLNECYDVYRTLVASNGRCIGMSGEVCPRIIVTGDSAGGNLACGTVLMILQSSSTDDRWHREEALPTPEGLILIYPGLDMNIGNWMTDDQMALIRERRMRKTNRAVLRRKSEDYSNLTPGTPHHSDDEEDMTSSPPQQPPASRDGKTTTVPSQHNIDTSLSSEPDPGAAHIINPTSPNTLHTQATTVATSKPLQLKTRLAMSSMISYFNDRILTPEMLRAMIILYIGPHARPDFTTDFLLSPLLAPESLLARFPKTHFLTGERDPLVDDTVIFAGRLRQAKAHVFRERQELGLEKEKAEFDEKDVVDVVLIPGISHGFLQFVGVFPEAWKYIFQCARWAQQIFEQGDRDRESELYEQDIESPLVEIPGSDGHRRRHHRRTLTESSGEEDRPLEMTFSSPGNNANTDGNNQPSTTARSGTRRGRGGRGGPKSQLPQPSSPSSNAGQPMPRKRSLVSLASEEDLLARRMRGLAGGLTGATQGQ
ncbi:MAG: hypothetical protein M1819_002175 [Sarea resinae]|nr:MAG: hypothetical protein M1819_002175 [Sarea resinae]